MSLNFLRTRLAPSPTGALHLGHARTFLVTWCLARQAGTQIVMRMEDLDAGRAKPESVAQAYEDLRWLGMDWDQWRGEAGSAEVAVVQSQRMGLYAEALQELWERGAIYPCTCTRGDIAASVATAANAPHAGEANVRYPGTCAQNTTYAKYESRNVAEIAAAVRAETGKNICWRLRVHAGLWQFDDLIAGPQAFDVADEVGDFPVTRFEGPPPAPAYQLACVVDDHDMEIDMVIRGDDLLSSTPRQICLYDALGWKAPQFAHVPLVVGEDGKRLAKRHGESRIAQFREAGVSAERLIGWAAWRCGQIAIPREMTAREMAAGFDLQNLPRERVVLGQADFSWLTRS